MPIIPDEARTFGLDALFRDVKIYSPFGQRYEPVDAELLLAYREARNGVILEEGITEAGVDGVVHRRGTAYATWGEPMIPFFIFYSMFGFQRVGDLIWSFGDQRGRGFLLGATAGRTTLTGEGLQHCDGQSQVLASTVPNCRAYDPAFAYEIAVIIRDGIERMYGDEPEDCFYYLTLYNENYVDAARCRDGRRGRDRRGPLPVPRRAERGDAPRADPRERHADARRARGAAAARRRARRRRRRVERDELQAAARGRAERRAVEPAAPRPSRRASRTSTEQLAGRDGPIVAVTDYLKAVPDQIARFVPQPFMPLGTDGYGFSDTRAALRRHFEVDAAHIVVAVLDGLAAVGDRQARDGRRRRSAATTSTPTPDRDTSTPRHRQARRVQDSAHCGAASLAVRSLAAALVRIPGSSSSQSSRSSSSSR